MFVWTVGDLIRGILLVFIALMALGAYGPDLIRRLIKFLRSGDKKDA